MKRVLGIATVLIANACAVACVGAFMFDASGARGGNQHPFPVIRPATLTAEEQANGCTLTRVGAPAVGGVIEITCPYDHSSTVTVTARACTDGPPPVTGGIYNSDGLLVGCKR